ncbi:MAG TPA: ABC transporter ATP-binding protein [Stellaceae bacterium]|nr:ABC transporter ATP-binding protein [Stellaceae bacterium]
MSLLRVEGIRKSHAGQAVLHGVDLIVPAGMVMALLGTSGCGKTTLLRLIAGFEAVDAGRVVMGDRVLAAPGIHVPVERRHIGYVPQEGTLFPHLTVEGNVGFGLRRAERRGDRVTEALQLTGLSGLERRYPHQLSGGQQQRTALARALAPGPGLILLDEPFNALDMTLRQSVCADVVALLRASGSTAILVTHDPQEAFTSADLIAVMRQGMVAQCADPATLYRQPIDAEVAQLTGATIFLDATMHPDGAETALGRLPVQPDAARSGAARILLRPEQIRLSAAGEGVVVRVLSSAFRGDHTLVTVLAGDVQLPVRLPGLEEPGQRLHLRVHGSGVAFPNG